MRRVAVMIIAAAVLIGGALLITQNQQAEQGASEQQSQLRTVTVERGDVVVTVRATGRVEPEQSAQLNFAVPGIVEEVLVEPGQTVQAGDVLARLDGEAQRIAVEQAEWALQIAQLSLLDLEAPPDDSELAAAQANVNSAWTAYVELRDNSVDPEEIRIAELRYQQALQAYYDADVTLRASQGADMQEAQAGASGFALEIARLQLEMLREGPTEAALNAALAQVGQAQSRLGQLEAGPTQAQLDRAAVALEQAQLQLERAQTAYEDTVLVAPFAGVVAQINVRAGGLALSSGPLPAAELVDLSALHVLLEVDEVDVALVGDDQLVEITVDALPDEILTGTVERVADVSSENEGVIVYEVRVVLDETTVPVRAGMTAAATIITRQVNDVLVVPNLYIRIDRRSGQAYADVLDESGNLVERAIELGAQNESMSEVISGLEEGEVIAIDLDAGGFSIFDEE